MELDVTVPDAGAFDAYVRERADFLWRSAWLLTGVAERLRDLGDHLMRRVVTEKGSCESSTMAG